MTTLPLEDRVIKKTLPNGLTVLIAEDHASPIVAVNVWFGVGSVNETEEMNGLAHFQEHMVFKGTRKYGVGEIANIVKSVGGNLNAGTSYSYTMYYIVLPSLAFETALEVQSDAMMNSTFDPKEFQKERLVVMDEARMYDDRPESFTFYRTMELGFREHTYRRPIAGYGPIVEKITREQLLDFYHNYYRPTNAVLVVVGDVDPDDAIGRIERVYGGWERGSVSVNEPPVEPAQESFRYQAHTGTMDHGYLGAGFHVPSILDDDYPALEMLSELLSSGRSSRLYRVVREEKRLVTSVGASLLAEKWPGFFLVNAAMPAERWDAARAAIFQEVERFKHEPVAEDELQKARRQIERSLCRDMETMEGQASNLGYYQLLGDFRLVEQHREAITSVTPDRLMEVARRYFHPDNCSLVSYLPEGFAGALPAAAVEEGMRAVLSTEGGKTHVGEATSAVEAPPDTTGARAGGAGSVTGTKGVRSFELDNGVRVLVKERRAVPMISLLTVFQGGGRFEPTGRSGLGMLTHRALTKGTASYEAEEIVERVESLGGSIESFANFDSGGVYLSVLSEQLEGALPVYREVVRQPRFDADRVTRERTRALEELGKRHDNPIHYAMDAMFERVFGDHPYAHPFFGKRSEAEVLEAPDCAAWYKSLLVPANAVVAFAGDIDEDRARSVAESLFSDLPAGPIPTPAHAAGERPAEPGVHVLRKKDLKQAVTFVGYTSPPMLTDESIALQVLNGVLTGLGGRLFVELRDKRSLGYMTGSALNPLFQRSIFFGYANPKPEGVDEAVSVIQTELEKVARELVTVDEFERSREWLIGTQLMQLQRNGSQATAYGTYEALGFGYGVVDRTAELIQKVTREAMRDAAAGVFRTENAVVIKLLPEE